MAKRVVQVAVVGGGPGGYTAAIRCAQLGKKTLLIEKEFLGGTCLNIGCIPSKALISAAGLVHKLKGAELIGISAAPVQVDLPRLQEWKNSIVSKLTGGIGQLCRGNGVEIILGAARFRDPHTLLVETPEGREEVAAETVILATGSVSATISGFPCDEKHILSSTGALALNRLPARMIVLGGGYIGLELGMAYARLGTQVVIVEMMKQLLPGADLEASRLLTQQARKLGMEVYLDSKADQLEFSGSEVKLFIETAGERRPFQADAVLVAVGRRPNTEGLDLNQAGVQLLPSGFVRVNTDTLQTTAAHVYAIGDVIGNPMLAHKASREAEVAANIINGKPAAMNYRCIPAVVFSDPEIASVGLTLEEARQAGYDPDVAKFPMTACGRAMTLREPDGFVKITFDKARGKILGVVTVGAEASELIAEAALAIEKDLTVTDIAHTVHAHPTLAETLMEAAKLAIGEPIHLLPRRRI